MKRRAPAPLPRLPDDLWRRAALLGLSCALLFGASARAGDLLRGGASAGARGSAPTAFGANPAITNQARKNATDTLARTTEALKSVEAMQAAARAAAIVGPNHLGPNPNHPGQLLPNVPNGLAPGGLQVAPGVPANLAAPQPGENAALWTGANLPTQSTAAGRTVVTVKQHAAQAILHWKTLNVGKETTLQFDQSAGGTNKSRWIAFNKISDPSGSPTQILGRIEGDGQAYIINQNGILFGGSSQVNLRSLTASSLPINDNLIKQGLLNNRDAQFLFSALDLPGGADGTPNFTPPAPLTPDGRHGDVVVKAGAQLSSPAGAAGNGGRVMLVGATVRNEGTIATPAGQTILAAGLQVAVAAHASNDPSLRGLDVWVGDVGDYAGTVTNSGLIQTHIGSTWMSGRYVNQLGVLESSTSVSLNGRIDLRASYGAVANPNFDSTNGGGAGGPPFLYQKTGIVTFGAQSTTRILPDYAGTKAVPGTELPERSQINIEGLGVHFGRSSTMFAPNGEVNIRAGVWPYTDADGNRTVFAANGAAELQLANQYSGTEQKFLFSGGQIFFDQSALLSVAGSVDVTVPMEQSILDVQLRGSEFADAPLQRSGVIRGVPLTVDIRRTGVSDGRYWRGTPLGDVTGLAGLIERNAAQLTAAGGSVTLQAGGSIVLQSGSTIDVSGGFFQHGAGVVKTSRLLQGGHLVDIHNALPSQKFDGVYTGNFTVSHAKYAVTEIFTTPWMTGEHYEPGYIEGASGGTLKLTAPSMALDGELLGRTIDVPRGRGLAPTLSSLSINFAAEKALAETAATLRFLPTSPTPPTLTFTGAKTLVPVASFQLAGDTPVDLPAARVAAVSLSPELLEEDGFGHLAVVNTDGAVIVPAKTNLTAAPLGSVSLTGANVTIHGRVVAPGGALSFTAHNISPAFTAEFPIVNAGGAPAPAPNVNRGVFTLDSAASLSTAGLWVDDRFGSPTRLTQPLVLNGGSVSIVAHSASLAAGTSIDVSGGVAVSGRGAVTYGTGGSLVIRTGKDPGFGTVLGGNLELGSTLSGYGGTKGGALTIQAGLIQIGGTAGFPRTLVLLPEFFRQGGFTSYALEGIGGPDSAPVPPDGPAPYAPAITIAPGVRIEPVAENWLAVPHPAGAEGIALRPELRAGAQRAPVSLSFSALGSDDKFTTDVLEVRGDIKMGVGAEIVTDPTATVAFKGQTVSILGAIRAPAGKITLAGAGSFPVADAETDNVVFGRPTVFIGPGARLSAAGVAVFTPDAFDRRIGTLYSGGAISVTGNIVASRGAEIDVSGASATFDVHPTALGNVAERSVPVGSGINAPLWRVRSVPGRVDSNGGTIDLQGSQMLFTDAALSGHAGGPTAIGGTLSIFSGKFYPKVSAQSGADINLLVTASGQTIAATNVNPGVGVPVLDAAGTTLTGMGYFSADQFARGGFHSLDLGSKTVQGAAIPFGGNVEFRGPVTITAPGNLRVAAGGVIQADSVVALTAKYLAIGQPFQAPAHPDDEVIVFQQDPPSPNRQYSLAPTFGTGSLAVKADLIEIGNLSLQNIGAANFSAAGDIRGNGTLQIAGDLTLHAGQIYPTTLSTFNVFAYDHGGLPGSVTITSSGARSTPLSAGGNLNVFASNISQGGVLRAPLGSIRLGWDGSDFDPSTTAFDSPLNPIAGSTLTVPTAQEVTLRSGSITSVAARDGITGAELLIPFGLSTDGLSWIDPRGVNITTSGLPEKRVTLAGNSVTAESGSTIDLRGGGDLSAFRWTAGTGGSVDRFGTASGEWGVGAEYQSGDLVTFGGQTWSARVRNTNQRPAASLYWSLVPESYAVLPGFVSEFAPLAAFNTGGNARFLGGDPGYVSSTLKVGDRVFLEATSELAAGTYTLLPRRYALLPGAFLVTPTTAEPLGTYVVPEGANNVAGYRVNAFARPDRTPTLRAQFEVASSEVARARARYDDYTGNEFIADAAKRLDIARVQRLPQDAGALAIHGNAALQLAGEVRTTRPDGGRGASIDVSSSADMYIVGGSGVAPVGAAVVLSDSLLRSWNAERLLIGGLRRRSADGETVDVRTSKLVLDNPGGVLTAADLLLASRAQLVVTGGSAVVAEGTVSDPPETLNLTGDGALLRVSSGLQTPLVRTGVTTSSAPLLSTGGGARISGGSVTLDSTSGTQLDSATVLIARALDLGSGQISIALDTAAPSLTGAVVSPHLVLAGQFSQDVQQSESLRLRSYRTIDLYGTGTFGSANLHSLALLAGGIRGFDQGAGTASLAAGDILLSNPANVAALAAPATIAGDVRFDAATIRLGANTFSATGYQTVSINATGGVLGEGTGTFTTPGSVTVSAPVITGARGSNHTVTAGGALVLAPLAGEASVQGGLGAGFIFNGTSVLAQTRLALPSGRIVLHATTGNVTVGGDLDVSGTVQKFYDLTRFSNGGEIAFTADTGNVELVAGSRVSVAASAGGGAAGVVAVRAAQGAFGLDSATLLGGADANSTTGSFTLDVRTLASFTDLSAALNTGGFFQTRNMRVRTGDITIADAGGEANVARDFALAADTGSISVSGTIDVSGVTGGKIALVAGGNLTVESTATLTAHAQEFSSAGKGGEIRLEAGAAVNGVANLTATLNLLGGSQIDLGVDASVPGLYTTPGTSAFAGQFAGTLHLRAPRNAANTGLRVGAINGTISGASSILVEGFRVTDLTSTGGLITGWRSTFTALPTAGTTQRTIYDSANSFLSVANYNSMVASLLGTDPQGLLPSLVIAPGVEIVNRTGDLTLGTTTSTALGSSASGNTSADWDLSDFRFGPSKAPGVLTLRAAGNIVLLNALSDGFRADAAGTAGGIFLPSGTLAGQSLWLSPLMRISGSLPVNTQSWSLRLAAGADTTAADFHAVKTLASLGASSGSLLLGKFYSPTIVNGATATTASALNNRFQTIRTGTGDIDIATGRDVQLRNQFATIYTAGVRLPEPTRIFSAGDFVEPVVALTGGEHPGQGSLGAVQQAYTAQWAMAGGDVTISAGADIWHTTQAGTVVIADSSAQLPVNWLYRRGLIDPATGLFGIGGVDTSGPNSVVDPSASTAWWIDYSNFFQGVGTLGGGDIALSAGSDIINVDAVLPTNARMAGRDPLSGLNAAPAADNLLELGGGNLTVRTGDNIDGGVYYVERGEGRLFANGRITTNQARSPSLGLVRSTANPEIFDSRTWLPTTLFLGKGGFDVGARGDVLIGPVANPFLLPTSLNNKFWYKTYFNTYSPDSSVDVASFGGSVTHRLAVTLPDQTGAKPILAAWLDKQNLFQTAGATSRLSNWQPWIRLAESTITPFSTAVTIMPPNLRTTAFAGDINIVGPMTLFPSPTGTLELAASGSIIGLQSTGTIRTGTPLRTVNVWTSATINLSDADPAAVPGVTSPFGYQTVAGNLQLNLRQTQSGFLSPVDALFQETGSYTGTAASVEVKRALHAVGALHTPATEPVRIYAGGGDITGVTLFSPQATQIYAANDITDVSFYIQNVKPTDISIVSAGRDIVPYNENAPIRSLAGDLARGNIVADTKRSTVTGITTSVLAGDIQISGPGVLEVLAARNLDLGTGANFTDGTGAGINSIGNFRNPFLPFSGADLIVLTGVSGRLGTGPAEGLSASTLDLTTVLAGLKSEGDSAYLEKLGLTGGLAALTEEQRAIVGLENFYAGLRQTGRDFATAATYAPGLASLEAVFGQSTPTGEIFTRARDIRTSTGGSITIGVPQGGITMASDIFGNPLTPPGIVTEYGGAISIFTDDKVDIGQARIFTLRGGDILIWSSTSDIAAGSAPKTVVTAPPTRVVIDATSADVQTDLGGLATGGGIGVLASVEGVKAGDVDLIAPLGVVDAGDAGIRATGNLTIAATAVLNASNIQVAGTSAGVPSAPAVSVPSIGALTQPQQQPTGGDPAAQAAKEAQKQAAEQQQQLPSIITVEVLGYGGGDGAEASGPP